MESSDGYCICSITGIEDFIGDEYLLPATTGIQVIRLNPTKFNVHNGWVHYGTEAGTIMSCRIVEDKYVNVAQYLPVEGVEITFPSSITEILEKVSVFTTRDHFIDEVVKITLKDKKIIVKGQSESGWYEEEANIRYNGEPLYFMITPYFLRDMLQRTQSCIVGKKMLKFQADNWQYVAMLRANEEQPVKSKSKGKS